MAVADTRTGAAPVPQNRIRSVQALRAVAALAVVVFHATNIWVLRAGPDHAWTWENGNAGVDLFFVISGFIILLSGERMAGKPQGAARFFELRLIRLIPMYWLATTLKLALVNMVSPAALVNGRPGVWNVLASYLFIPSRNAEGAIYPVLIVGWTLSYELLFYVLFAVAMVITADPLVLVVPTLALLTVLGAFRTADWPAFTAVLGPLLLEFCLGMLIARCLDRGVVARVPRVAGLVLLLAGAACLTLFEPASVWLRTAVWGTGAGCCLVGALTLERYFTGPLSSLFVLIGEASYAVYLTHGFILPAVGFAATRLPLPAPALGAAIVVSCVVMSSAVGVVVHLFAERPMIDYLRQIARDRRGSASPAAPASPI